MTMISNKEMLTIVGCSEKMMTTIINQEMTIVTIVSSGNAFADMKTMFGNEEIKFSIRVLFYFLVFGIAFKQSTKMCISDRDYLCLPA